jgi:hypothetical protein
LFSKSGKVGKFSVLQESTWMVHGTSEDSPDAAKRDLAQRVLDIGGNAVLHMQYYKTKGSSGNYIYSIHHFKGVAAQVGQQTITGDRTRESFADINSNAEELYYKQTKNIERLQRRENSRHFSRKWIFIILALFSFYLAIEIPPVAIIGAVLLIKVLFFNSKYKVSSQAIYERINKDERESFSLFSHSSVPGLVAGSSSSVVSSELSDFGDDRIKASSGNNTFESRKIGFDSSFDINEFALGQSGIRTGSMSNMIGYNAHRRRNDDW